METGLVVIASGTIEDIVAHARAEAPRECCGLLIGTRDRVERAFRTRNALYSRTRYQVEAADHFEALRTARSAGFSVVGAYHSHPTSPPEPSPRDVDEAAYDDFIHVIVGLAPPASPEVRAYRYVSGNFSRVTLVP